jgi:signal transduction histidine kinase
MKFQNKTIKTKNIKDLFNKIVSPSKKFVGTDDYYKSKFFNSFVLISLIIELFAITFRIAGILIFNDLTSKDIIVNTSMEFGFTLMLFVIGKSDYYQVIHYIFPLFPLLAIWPYYDLVKNDLSIEFIIITPIFILIIGLVVGGLFLNIRQFIVYWMLIIIDMIIFYGFVSNFSIATLISRFIVLFLIGIFLLFSSNFRIKLFRILTESNKKLSKEVDINQNNLIEERVILYSLIANLQEGVTIIDFTGNPLIANNNFINYYLEITEKNFNLNQEIDHDLESESFFYKFVNKAKENLSISEIFEKNNNYYLLISNLLKINLDSKTLGIIIEIHNITDVKTIEILEKKFRQLIMHELRTPTTSLQLSISNLAKYWDKLKENDRQKILQSMQEQSNKFTQIIEKITLLSDLENMNEFKFINIDVKSFIDEIKNRCVQRKVTSHVLFVNDKTNHNGILNVDREMIFKALSNIVDNSEKFSNNSTEISIDLYYQEKNYFTIEVKDLGMGIDNTDIPFLFTRFFKGKLAENLTGQGLGLSIAKEILKKHKGNILLKSKIGEGTSVFILLPLIESFHKINNKIS